GASNDAWRSSTRPASSTKPGWSPQRLHSSAAAGGRSSQPAKRSGRDPNARTRGGVDRKKAKHAAARGPRPQARQDPSRAPARGGGGRGGGPGRAEGGPPGGARAGRRGGSAPRGPPADVLGAPLGHRVLERPHVAAPRSADPAVVEGDDRPAVPGHEAREVAV